MARGNGASDCAVRRNNYRSALEAVLTSKSLDEIWKNDQVVQEFNQHAGHCTACAKIRQEIVGAVRFALRKIN